MQCLHLSGLVSSVYVKLWPCREPDPGSLQSAPSHDLLPLPTASVNPEQQLVNLHERQEAYQIAAAALAKLRRYLHNKDTLRICDAAEIQPETLTDADISMAEDIERLRG